ncbi:hypothetical protein PRIPAC_80014 [Pristionchus pacificus]|uniref:Uncharacterized protein n=1 Tax=Pristionchus pacificus TaxID=54126 RepID=A0A2A6CKD9_PRIPA|nr:hypothetical protein PRIPAC_80014 [Pristionchus pacificus]|eukprot:PDM78684.1 hypothetical protein PRIPAC_31263 [Pristionchus pacificus]
MGIAAACAPHSPKKGCSPLKAEPAEKCTSLGVTCTPATISKTSATCPAGHFILVDTDDSFAGTDNLFCRGGKWWYRDNANPTGGALEGVITGDADMNVACVMI